MNAMVMAVMSLFWLAQADTPASVSAQPALPPGLAALAEAGGGEKLMVDAMRKLDLSHVANGLRALEDAEQLMQKGEKETAQERVNEAKSEFQLVRTGWEYVLQKFPANARAQTYYGELLYDQFDEQTEAVKIWQKATTLDPKLALPFNDLGIHYCHVGQYEQGIVNYDTALKLDPENVDFMFNLAQCYLTNFPVVQRIRSWTKPRLYKEAMKLSRKAIKLNPADFELTHDYAMNLFLAERFDVRPNWKDTAAAWREVRKIARNDAERMNAWLYEGRAWLAKGNYPEAETCFLEAEKIKPDSEVAKSLLEEVRKNMKEKPSRTIKKTESGTLPGGKQEVTN